MKSTGAAAQATKRPVNLTLSESTVEQARRYTNNLSATVDGLLAEFIAREAQAREEKRQLYTKVSEAWNRFDERYGTFGSEHSPL
ncbi:type II toxin-antitoxin system CcdA family antitoxin [Thauera sp. Sel9]|uniref:type II toxin-antitoxin system CcdA family antitoxin n=1 Tax=Thauera sp. Sel9 TaxID=2974299 RepID=UPI0021E190C7|nr:type II toxin-antitoxin system CcdA family antitoxin [Thauera sp. Sel9]MCV2216669.1 type II toxin-antitoxin system CcdA family antitoxin [Thauera sp. Sel9]